MLGMQSCKQLGRGDASDSDASSTSDAKAEHEGAGHHGQEADSMSAGGAKKRRRCVGRVAASTGKFASESAASVVLQQVLQPPWAGGVDEGGDVDREEEREVVFPLSKSQQHKQDGKASRRRRMVGKTRPRG